MDDEAQQITGSAQDGNQRAEAIRSLGLLDDEDSADFDELAAYAAEACEAPIGLVTLVGHDRQWAKGAFGTEQRLFGMDESICSHGLSGEDFLEVEDCASDPRTATNPLVISAPGVRYYGGAIIKLNGTLPVGALCVLDHRPRRLDADKKRLLTVLARQLSRRMELRRAIQTQEILAREVDHRVKNSLQMVTSLVRIQRAQAQSEETRAALAETGTRLAAISAVHAELHKASAHSDVALDIFLPDIGASLGRTLPDGVDLTTEICAITVPSQIAASIALVLNEAVANAAKHAFAEGAPGSIRVKLTQEQNSGVLVIADDGRGLEYDDAGQGLGEQIIDASANRIGGTVERDAEDGFTLTLRFPLQG
ncbi:sensor histidine kinase [Pseudoroseicyclus aestuarii]|uniref:Two-component sensor histidine kinase n=1 Tax=Pseudoroseicyclus aestuarii TaxID=1795041 RepID=A0A318SZ06_9RHOB|nr:histidine kinase dimerization/phosphoacceptor domain -containing protein [Pseudoroseicyclus aestuarii]PYE81224.1 two-component sensor histidine kinase [Pseudoroseicyclus aestuarii]